MTAQKMTAQEIIAFIGNAEKKTNVKVTFEGELAAAVPENVLKLGNVLFGDGKDIEPLLANLTENKDYVVEQDGRNSAVPLLDKRHLNARIEPGAIIRDQVTIEDNAVVMMGAVINIGAEIGAGTMIDMGAVLGGLYHTWSDIFLPLDGPSLITFHNGFAYLADAFHFDILRSIEEEGSEISAREMAELTQLIEEYQLPAIFTEVNGSDASAQALARDTGVKVYTLSMVMSGDESGILPYLSAIDQNMATIMEGMEVTVS